MAKNGDYVKINELDVFQKHQKAIAIKTLKYSDQGAFIMGGMTKDEARKFLKSIGYSDNQIKKLEESKLSEAKVHVGTNIKGRPVKGSKTAQNYLPKTSYKVEKKGNTYIFTASDGYQYEVESGEYKKLKESKLTENGLRQAIRAMIEQELDQFDIEDEEQDKCDIGECEIECVECDKNESCDKYKKEEELDETSSVAAQGGQDGYQTPYAFAGRDKAKQKQNAEQLGYKLVNQNLEERDWDDIINARKEALVYRRKFAEMKTRSGLNEAANPKKGRKSFYTMDNVGKRGNYTINAYDGKATHKDGSPFYDIRIFRDKKKYQTAMKDLTSKGYVEESVIKEEVSQQVKDDVTALLKSYGGKEVPDDKVHAIADKHGISPHELESFIYSLASQHVNEGTHGIAKIYIGENPYWLRKMGDTTHFHMANSAKGIKTGGVTYHIGQHRDELYYNDLVKWLKGVGKINGKKYTDFFRQLSKIESIIEDKKDITNLKSGDLVYLKKGKDRGKVVHWIDSTKLLIKTKSGQRVVNLSAIDAVRESKDELTEGRRGAYHEYRDDGDKTPRQKIGESLRNVRDQLTEIEKTIDLNLRLKQETGINIQQYWKNTHRALNKINERMTQIINKIRRF